MIHYLAIRNVEFLGTCNERLILEVSYVLDGDIGKQTMIIRNGQWHFRETNMFTKLLLDEQISRKQYQDCMNDILKEANRWCEDLGVPEITQKT